MTFEEYTVFLAEIRKLTELDMLVPDETGLVTFRVNDTYTMNLQFITDSSKILCFVEVMTLDHDPVKNATIYRDLLAAGLFGEGTAGGYFALEPQTEMLVYHYIFDGDRAAQYPTEFVQAIEQILQLCDMWVDRIKSSPSNSTSASTSAGKHDEKHSFSLGLMRV